MQEFEKIKRRIMNVATEACGYAPLTRVAAESELKEIIENVAEEYATDTNVGTNGWIPCSGCADCNHKECEHYGKV